MQRPANLIAIESAAAGAELRSTLMANAHPAGGWGYAAGKTRRLEPTCWALLALGSEAASHREFLDHCRQPDGWLVEDPIWPINVAFNALAAFTLLAGGGRTADVHQPLLDRLVASKGVQAPPSEVQVQDNLLQGWSWLDATFSWVEPTCWGLLALKRARRAGLTSPAADARIAEGEALLVDRTCRAGGWNFGNSNVMHQDLRAYVPTTALGLLAMRDRPDDPAVIRSLAFLESHWIDEISAAALGLSLLALRSFDRPAGAVEARLRDTVPAIVDFGNWHGAAIALSALPESGALDAFAI